MARPRHSRLLAATTLCLIALVLAQSPPGVGAQQLSIGNGSTLVLGNVTIVSASVNCTLSNGAATTCLQVTSKVQADHAMGPWCQGGNWNESVINVTGIDCNNQGNYTSCPKDSNGAYTLCLRCLECAAKSFSQTFLIPLNPTKATSTSAAQGDNNIGDAMAINGIPMAKADPLAVLSAQNNPAPIDWFGGGHATLQYVYHYHAIPPSISKASMVGAGGWNSSTYKWADAAPNGNHSPLIGWAFDGYPVFGPYSNGGTVPTDLDSCYMHSHTPYGSHYHSKVVHDGKTHAFLGCYNGPWVSQTSAAIGGGGGGAAAAGGGASTTTTTTTATSEGALAVCASTITQTSYTQRCCGDGVCDGPETTTNCAADCASKVTHSSTGVTASSGSTSSSSSSGSSGSTTKVNATTTTVLVLGGVDYTSVVSNTTARTMFEAGVCAAAVLTAPNGTVCTILDMKPGSIVTTIQLYIANTNSNTNSALDAATNTFASDPQAALSKAAPTFASTFSVTSYSATITYSSNSSSSSKTLSTGAIIGIAVGGAVLLALLVGLTVWAVRKRTQAVHPMAADKEGGTAPLMA